MGAISTRPPSGSVRELFTRSQGITAMNLAVSTWVVFAFAMAQPLLELLGRNPEFFLARASPVVDIVVVALVALVGLPALLVLGVLLARLLHPLAGLAAHGVVFVTLVAVLTVGILEGSPARPLHGWLDLALGAAVGLLAWIAYLRWGLTRTLFRYAAIGPPAFLIAFVVFSPVSQLILTPAAAASPAAAVVGNPVPVVMIVFDEFPVASLIDSEGEILAEVYPNFARLVREGIWFRNAVGVEQQTEQAIPAMIMGRRPSNRDSIPISADFPLTVFSLLSDTYEIRAIESVTELCPDYACSNRARVVAPLPARWMTIGQDLAVVAAHLALPSDLAGGLPSISQTWGNFAEGGAVDRDSFDIIARFNEYVDADRRVQVRRFLELITRPADQPTLDFAHILLPHIPWTYLPSGQQYRTGGRAAGSTPTGWTSDEWLVMQAYQRHLLQVQYTDRIIGQVLSALEIAGRYEETLLLVVADHGTADIPNVEHRRVITEETIGHVAAVPLFVKLPYGGAGGVDDYRAETTDLLPTIADVLDVRVPWNVEGVSLLSPTRPERESTTMIGTSGPVTFGVDGLEKLAVARWKMAWFGSGDPFELAPPGYRYLLGTMVEDLSPLPRRGLTFTLDHPGWYRDVEPEGDMLPARVSGRLVNTAGFTGDSVVALALNGRVEAVVRTYDTTTTTTQFQAMLPPSGFRSGHNEIDVILLAGRPPDLTFHRAGGP